MVAITQQRLREIAARRDPAELAAVVEMLADDTPVDGTDGDWICRQGFTFHALTTTLGGTINAWWRHKRVLLSVGDAGCTLCVIAKKPDGIDYEARVVADNPTRGQLRCLILALSPGGE